MKVISFAYSWIRHPVQTHTQLICRETKRATTDLNIRMKNSRQGASNGAGYIFISPAQLDAPCRKLYYG